MIRCALTQKVVENPIYHSQSERSITSLSQIYKGSTLIYLNEDIGHLQTKEMKNIEDYYDKQYQFFNQSEEDDILYADLNGKKVFRQEHQVNTLLSKINFESGMKILDYGCAKGTVMKRLSAQKPNVVPYLFDVSQLYVHLWEKFLPSEQYASYNPKHEWTKSFDLITSFFAFEHVLDPIKELLVIKSLLRENGIFYCVVPNIFDNIGDFIVVDHVHHYSKISLNYMFSKVGLEVIEIDTKSHFGAFIVLCKNTNSSSIHQEINQSDLYNTNYEFLKIAKYWENIRVKIRDFELSIGNQQAAVYGAGVYGNFIATCIQNLENIKCFIDQNLLLKGKKMLDKPILHPTELPLTIINLYIGLNPEIASQAILNIEEWKHRQLNYLFL
jgi:cyclopropane fatty-acyl-phospholipid synthase-like methyltransferase